MQCTYGGDGGENEEFPLMKAKILRKIERIKVKNLSPFNIIYIKANTTTICKIVGGYDHVCCDCITTPTTMMKMVVVVVVVLVLLML